MAGEIDEKHKQKQKDTAHSDNSSNYLCRRVPIVTRVTPLHEYLLDGHLMKTFISATYVREINQNQFGRSFVASPVEKGIDLSELLDNILPSVDALSANFTFQIPFFFTDIKLLKQNLSLSSSLTLSSI
ncbi:hypothetical protein LOAG_01307 [Loa loa]|uniref:Uncharacterized protein n=1 Tax=Loa loa TaxID=7209 RepID=A0A1S0U9E7_LOALO|nr:hypothetical protein LOAG_01307 [Loa loa]EFO27182.1 hypothetical protein LOAG_01307 [Loa loa]